MKPDLLNEDLRISFSENLFLRPISPDDFEPLWNLIEASREHYKNIQAIITIFTQEEFSAYIQRAEDKLQEKSGISLTLEVENNPAGVFSFNNISWPHRRAEIGYWLGAKYAGSGIATRAVRELVRFGFEQLQLNKIEAGTATTNTASIKLLQRLGFKQEGLLRQRMYINGQYVDDYSFGLLNSEWR